MKCIKPVVSAVLSAAIFNYAFAWTHSPASKEIGANGGSFTLTVSGTEYYDWTAGAAYADWITVTRVNAKTFTVTVAANDTSEVRGANVTINAFQGGSTHSAQTFVNMQNCGVTQAAQDKPSVSPTTISFPKEGGNASVGVTAASADSWSVGGVPSWLSVNAYTGKGSGAVMLSAPENADYEPRSVTLTIAGNVVSVYQPGVPGYSRISYSNVNGASHSNPSYYKEGEELVFTEPSPVDWYQFLGWMPPRIEASITGLVEVVAQWKEMWQYFAISNVCVAQEAPWSGKLSVSYEVHGDLSSWAKNTGNMLTARVVGVDQDTQTQYVAKELSGDLSFSPGRHSFVWDLDADGMSLNSSNFAVSISCSTNEAPYCVVDLSSGSSSTNYPVSFVMSKPDVWSNADKTSKIYLKRIAPGGYERFVPGAWVSGRVEVSQPYYMAVFEMTEDQQQYIVDAAHVTGSCKPVTDYGSSYATHNPRGNNIGALWPETNSVDEDSVIGKLRTRTGLKFDLPTCAQWNLACGAGTSSIYFWGNDSQAGDSYVVRNYDYETVDVGGKLPNPWGLYDMAGNVAEMCLDWYSEEYATNEVLGVDPKGPLSGEYRTLRGGSVSSNHGEESYGFDSPYMGANHRKGYRLCLPSQMVPCTMTLNASSDGVKVNNVNKMTEPEIGIELQDEHYVVTIEWPNSWPVFCTFDGSDPFESGVRYERPFMLSRYGSKCVRAIAVSPEGTQSEISTYEIPAPNAPTILPADKTILSSATSVNIATDNPDATIYCTTDGTEPTTSSPVYKRFKASSKMRVKAIAVVEGMAWSETTTAEYALGQCADPTISPVDGTVFRSSNYQVSIAKNGEKGVLRYTTDGSDPTEASPVYSGPFAISETTTVKAKVFDTDYFDSAVVSATLTRQWTKVATPVIVAPESFSGTKLSVTLTCATDGAVIRYTTDGSEPNSHSPKYTKPFDITGTTVVKAIALKTDCTTSDVATMMISKQWCIGDALNDSDRQFTTDVGTGWIRDTSVSHDGSESMKSGAITDSATMGVYATSTLSTVVDGKGTVRFWWKASCEEDGDYGWDHGEFRVDGVTVARINGVEGWSEIVHEIFSAGSHTIAWIYCKDDFGKEGEDSIWVDQFAWQPNDPIPDLGDNPTAQQVAAALDGSADARLAENIADGATYGKYRMWATKVKGKGGSDPVGAEAVKASSNVWLSFALDSETLIENAPGDGDVTIDSFVPTAVGGAFELAVGVEGVYVGEGAAVENLAKLFGLEGGEKIGAMSADKVSVSFGEPTGGKVRLTAGPKDAPQATFFMRVRMTP